MHQGAMANPALAIKQLRPPRGGAPVWIREDPKCQPMVALESRAGGIDQFAIGADMVLGTVSAPSDVPVEEYWSIYLVTAGTHTFTTYKNNVKIVKTVTLENDGFFLASLDPEEEALFYSNYGDVFEMSPDAPLDKKIALPKKAGGEKRIIQFNKQVEGRERSVR